MLRNDKLLASLKRDGAGLEIGPSYRPVAAKRDGYTVEVVDHLDRAGLVAKYAAHGVDLAAIEEVDFVWKGESYAELTGRRNHYDWIIASHVIEHTPDLISFLKGCEEVLNDEGVLSLAVPDKRYCFDRLRARSSLASVVDAHEARRTIHSVGTAADYFLNVTALDKTIAWGPTTSGQLDYVHTLDDAATNMQAIRSQGAFPDLHAWCFTPSSFRLLMRDLFDLGYTRLREAAFFDTEGYEFFVSLSARGAGPRLSRLDLARRVEAEEAAVLASVSREERPAWSWRPWARC